MCKQVVSDFDFTSNFLNENKIILNLKNKNENTPDYLQV